MIFFRTLGLSLTFLFIGACSDLEESEHQRLRKMNQKGQVLSRKSGEKLFAIPTMELEKRKAYPWEHAYIGQFHRITKEYFRCKGNPQNPVIIMDEDREIPTRLSDCCGGDEHSLPIREDEEFVYPILLDLLNYIQAKAERRVVVTSGHRCPVHNKYLDPSSYNSTSKHQIAGEVDFYVQGWEEEPEKVLDLLKEYYREHPEHKEVKSFTQWERYEKDDTNVSTPPWYNKEVFVKLFKANEGRNLDNRHPHPYISIQVRYDLDRKERAFYSWERAQRYRRD